MINNVIQDHAHNIKIMKKDANKKELSSEQQVKNYLKLLKARFEKNINRHKEY